jgi:hypothetical protein
VSRSADNAPHKGRTTQPQAERAIFHLPLRKRRRGGATDEGIPYAERRACLVPGTGSRILQRKEVEEEDCQEMFAILELNHRLGIGHEYFDSLSDRSRQFRKVYPRRLRRLEVRA